MIGTSEKRSQDAEEFDQKIKIIIVDIEGTTTSISFVKDTLFPYIRENLQVYLKSHWKEPEFVEDLTLLRKQAESDKENGVEGLVPIPAGNDEEICQAVLNNILWQMDLDRKTKALKQLQGHVMREGYMNGKLKGHVYDDVQPALKSWKHTGRQVYVYSSGSVAAQKLLFEFSEKGDLLELFSGHFDTDVGSKIESSSYSNIAKQLNCKSEEIMFLTDIPKEAMAAREAGLLAVLVVRPGNAPLTDDDCHKFRVIKSFDDIVFEASAKRKKLSVEEPTANTVSSETSNNVDSSMQMDVDVDDSCPKVSEGATLTSQSQEKSPKTEEIAVLQNGSAQKEDGEHKVSSEKEENLNKAPVVENNVEESEQKGASKPKTESVSDSERSPNNENNVKETSCEENKVVSTKKTENTSTEEEKVKMDVDKSETEGTKSVDENVVEVTVKREATKSEDDIEKSDTQEKINSISEETKKTTDRTEETKSDGSASETVTSGLADDSKPAESDTKTAVVLNEVKSVDSTVQTKTDVSPDKSKTGKSSDETKTVVSSDENKTAVPPEETKTVKSSDETKPVVSTDETKPVVSTDETTPVVSTDETKPVVSTDETKPVVSTDETKPVVSTDETKPVVSTDETKPVVSTNETKPVVSTDETKPVVSTDETKTVVSTGETKTVVSTGETKTVVSTDETKTVVSTDETKTVVSTDETKTVVYTDETKTVVYTDETKTVVYTDETKTVVSTNETKTVVSTNETKTVVSTDETKTAVSSGETKTAEIDEAKTVQTAKKEKVASNDVGEQKTVNSPCEKMNVESVEVENASSDSKGLKASDQDSTSLAKKHETNVPEKVDMKIPEVTESEVAEKKMEVAENVKDVEMAEEAKESELLETPCAPEVAEGDKTSNNETPEEIKASAVTETIQISEVTENKPVEIAEEVKVPEVIEKAKIPEIKPGITGDAKEEKQEIAQQAKPQESVNEPLDSIAVKEAQTSKSLDEKMECEESKIDESTNQLATPDVVENNAPENAGDAKLEKPETDNSKNEKNIVSDVPKKEDKSVENVQEKMITESCQEKLTEKDNQGTADKNKVSCPENGETDVEMEIATPDSSENKIGDKQIPMKVGDDKKSSDNASSTKKDDAMETDGQDSETIDKDAPMDVESSGISPGNGENVEMKSEVENVKEVESKTNGINNSHSASPAEKDTNTQILDKENIKLKKNEESDTAKLITPSSVQS